MAQQPKSTENEPSERQRPLAGIFAGGRVPTLAEAREVRDELSAAMSARANAGRDTPR